MFPLSRLVDGILCDEPMPGCVIAMDAVPVGLRHRSANFARGTGIGATIAQDAAALEPRFPGAASLKHMGLDGNPKPVRPAPMTEAEWHSFFARFPGFQELKRRRF